MQIITNTANCNARVIEYEDGEIFLYKNAEYDVYNKKDIRNNWIYWTKENSEYLQIYNRDIMHIIQQKIPLMIIVI